MQNPAEKLRCNAWNKRCPDCNYKFAKSEPKSLDHECPVCGRKRTRCRRVVQVSGQRCSRSHGGNTPRGPASPNWQHGRYSKYLPTGLGERYQEARRNPELMSLRDDIAMVDARITELVEELAGMRADESASTWTKAKQTYSRMKRAIREQDGATVIAAMEVLDGVFEEGRSPVRIWDEILDLMAKKSRLIEMDSRVSTRERLVISVEEFNILVARTVGIIKQHVHDQSAIQAIVREFTDAVVAPTGESARLGDGIEPFVEASPWPTD